MKKRKGLSKRTSIIAVIGGLLLISCLFLAALPGANQSKATPTSVPTAVAAAQSQQNGLETTVAATLNAPTATYTSAPIATILSVTPSAATSTAVPEPTSTVPPATNITALTVDFIDVGQGDSILLTTSDGKAALIDGGEQGSGVLKYLQSKNINHIDVMIATHPHSDHIGGLVDVLNSMPVSKVVTNGQPTTTQIYEHFLDGIAKAKAVYSEAKRGDTIPFGGLAFQVLSPASISGDDLNHNSLVMRLAFGKVTYLFMGDADQDAEASILAAGLPVKADILKVGHHGSRSASSPAFLAVVKPAVAVNMAGVGNDYGHPHPETIATLTNVGAQIEGTDVNGTIEVSSDGNTYNVTLAKTATRAPPVTAEATAEPQAGPLSLTIQSVTSPISRGAMATLAANTAPGANCTIAVYYKSGKSSASGLGPTTADASGNVSWSWKVGARTTPGNWKIIVTASANGETVTQETSFTVQ